MFWICSRFLLSEREFSPVTLASVLALGGYSQLYLFAFIKTQSATAVVFIPPFLQLYYLKQHLKGTFFKSGNKVYFDS